MKMHISVFIKNGISPTENKYAFVFIIDTIKVKHNNINTNIINL